MFTVFIGIGSNLGDRLKNIEEAINYLRSTEGVIVEKVSSLIETEPVGGPPQGKYLNGVIKIKTSISPHKLLEILNTIEYRLGRKRGVINGPRTLDLDILLYGDLIIQDKDLTIPHPRMWEREFVIKPLLEIEPDLGKSKGIYGKLRN
ncbi:MAG: 2-amino-4-hydroxy-6-hydroxymethyldihydropteridine diphosphokinase [Candidatus Omnitrophica bacterium]|nr:2-amino-4-hydroxy-6-hydroxymethyldihydropteridine diphosphokinase [Candidatus Omnitrophota bacterium]MCM8825948.1 2-amino-4-hydroxy-6-hydroxymethyldihydropteridine diphosphokinase [Candidatus Omnitrophota bacterium]